MTRPAFPANNAPVIEPAPTPELPARFGQFYLFDRIGRGGMAEIFLSKTFTALGTERLCVIKRILPQLNADEHFCEMLIQEAKLASRLSHANVVQTYDLGKIEGQYYIAMEYVEGVDLNQLLGLLARARIALPLQFALYVIAETLRGLDYAHRLADADGRGLEIIHRDVSPTNVLISTEGEVKLCDFGIARATQMGADTPDSIDEYHLKGKVAYMSPEQVHGRDLDQRADLFAAGILLWELLSGRRLYKTKDEDETLRRAREVEVPPLADRGFPEFEMLDAVVRKALAPDPIHRFQSGGEFIRALEDYMHVAGMIVSQLRFADFLMENFGEDLLTQRRERERHLSASIDRLTFVAEEDAEPPDEAPSPANDDGAPARADDLITQSLLASPDDEDEEEDAQIAAEEPANDAAGDGDKERDEERPEDADPADAGPGDGKKRGPGPAGEPARSGAGIWIAVGLVAAAATAAGVYLWLTAS